MKQTGIIAWKEFSDRLRSGWVIACVLVWLGAITLTSLFGLVQIGKIGFQGYERTVVSLLGLAQYLVPLLALLLGHDLLAAEREERTLALIVSCGVSRFKVLLGKFLGGTLALTVPLGLGFLSAGIIIGMVAKTGGVGTFVRLALTGIGLGVVFLAIGLVISTIGRTRVQTLVLALLTWCAAIFVFDLAAMGVLVATRAPSAARELETATDAVHVNNMADLHASYEAGDDAAARRSTRANRGSSAWLMLNPVDLFRALNLPKSYGAAPPRGWAAMATLGWLGACLWAGGWNLKRWDL